MYITNYKKNQEKYLKAFLKSPKFPKNTENKFIKIHRQANKFWKKLDFLY